jgi:hypothetical protein
MANWNDNHLYFENELINPPATFPSRLVKPIDVIHHRLKREAVEGGILEGLQVIPSPLMRVEGKDQLPNVCMVDYSDTETGWDGAKTNSGMSTNQVETEVNALFLLSFAREDGSYSNPLNQPPWGFINWVERFKDAIELDDLGQCDVTLEMSCVKPHYTHVRESEILELSWSVLIEVELYPVPIQRGTRRFGWKMTEDTGDYRENAVKIPR